MCFEIDGADAGRDEATEAAEPARFLGSRVRRSEEDDTANLGGQAVVINDLVGNYLCYRTNMSLPGWLLITGLDPTTGILNVEILTWTIP